jgi:hypothetical protein
VMSRALLTLFNIAVLVTVLAAAGWVALTR